MYGIISPSTCKPYAIKFKMTARWVGEIKWLMGSFSTEFCPLNEHFFSLRITFREKSFRNIHFPSGVTLKLLHSYHKEAFLVVIFSLSAFTFQITIFLTLQKWIIWSFFICWYLMNVLFSKWLDLVVPQQNNLDDYFSFQALLRQII